MSELSRRQFLHDSLIAAAVAGAAPLAFAAEANSVGKSPNDKLARA